MSIRSSAVKSSSQDQSVTGMRSDGTAIGSNPNFYRRVTGI
ncbi:MAG: hypothetical protein QM785_18330 [Pyrinomonadaceae bacterium]